MAPRKTRAAAKAQTEPQHSDEPHDNEIDSEDQAPERDLELDPADDEDEEEEKLVEEDMSKPKGKKSKKGGKKKGKKTKTAATEVTSELAGPTTVKEAIAQPAVAEDEEFNAAAMPVLRSPKRDVEQEPVGECRQIASSFHPNEMYRGANYRSPTNISRDEASPNDKTSVGNGRECRSI
jgi:hypothetical protein